MRNQLTVRSSGNAMNAPVYITQGKKSYQTQLAFVTTKIPELRAILADLFPGPMEVEIDEDPEIEGKRYLVFQVETCKSVQDVLALRGQWYRMKDDLLGEHCDLACLEVAYRE